MERLWNKVDKRGPSDCWLWTGAVASDYGLIMVAGRTVQVHRVVWQLAHGEIPVGNDVHHSCETKLCCNPQHLELKPHAEHSRHHNPAEMCPHGVLGKSKCKQCHAETALRSYHRRKRL